ncbi:hypothetical protein BDP27DRAFT_246639 [Rhodocollybia butyracea]|uniref:Uncharacterized protein n=1 Tax=Rhodocollybia butyracea TaxID=206335 RepID=A0A9P5PWX5_9AGAR|nr:hypothetical protein BDP27DRAFT_246639 [Rhodocollybia butyracea]
MYATLCLFLSRTNQDYRRKCQCNTRSSNSQLAYLEQFGQPLLPFQRERESYEYQKRSPLESGLCQDLEQLPISPSIREVIVRTISRGYWRAAKMREEFTAWYSKNYERISEDTWGAWHNKLKSNWRDFFFAEGVP